MQYILLGMDFNFSLDDKVRIKLNPGVYVKGIVVKINTYFNTFTGWKTSYDVKLNGSGRINQYSASEMISDDSGPKCECGSDKLDHPGHSHYCPKGE